MHCVAKDSLPCSTPSLLLPAQDALGSWVPGDYVALLPLALLTLFLQPVCLVLHLCHAHFSSSFPGAFSQGRAPTKLFDS